MERPAVVAISSHVAAGAVGNRVVRAILEGRGFTVIDLPTVLLSHHPGHGAATRHAVPAPVFAAILDEAIARVGSPGPAGILTGYFADPAQVEAAAAAVGRVRQARPDALFLCDPVIGDGGRLYQSEAIASAIRDRLLPLADIATPNRFEAAWLAGHSTDGDPIAAAQALRLPEVVVTSAHGLLRGGLANLLIRDGGVGDGTMLMAEHRTARLRARGTGDAFSAFFLAERLAGRSSEAALADATAATLDMIVATAAADADELILPTDWSRPPRHRPLLRRLAGGAQPRSLERRGRSTQEPDG